MGTYGGWFNPMDEDSIYRLECEGTDVVGVQYHWPQELLHAGTDGRVTKDTDNAICNDSLPVGSGLNGAPSGKRVKTKADECIRFEPPRFTPWSYKVRCIQGLDLAPWPDANIIRNQPGDPKHGEMIASECAPCTKKNIQMAGPEERAAAPANRTFKENICCTDGIVGPYGTGKDCFSLNRGMLAVIVAAVFVIIGVPSCFYCYKMSKKVEYKALP